MLTLRRRLAIAKSNEEITTTLNVLVVGMPNMGKSTLLNSLRWAGTNNCTFKVVVPTNRI